MGRFQKTTCIFDPAQFLIVKCSGSVLLGLITLNPAVDISYDQQIENLVLLCVRAGPSYKFKITRLVKKWTIWSTFEPKFPDF